MAGLVPAIPLRKAQCVPKRDARVKPAHDGGRGRSSMETTLLFPALGGLYQTLAPWAEAALRVTVGLALVPHGLRNTFGMFPKTGVRSHNLADLAPQLDHDGYRPGKLGAPPISVTPLVAGPPPPLRP